MKLKPIILVFLILLISGGCLLFKKNFKPKKKIVGFKVESPSFETNSEIIFTDTTKTSLTRTWDFGDSTSTSSNSRISHIYETAGKYKVQLVIDDSTLINKSIHIVTPKSKSDLWANFEYLQKNISVGQAVSFKDLSKNANSWEWKFGESNDSTIIDSKEQNPKYTFKEGGYKKITLVINKDYIHSRTSYIYVSKEGIKDGVTCEGYGITPKCIYPTQDLNEVHLNRALIGISQNELSYKNFAKFFCKNNMPEVKLAGGNSISLKELDENIRGKSIKINEVHFEKDKNKCITKLYLNYE